MTRHVITSWDCVARFEGEGIDEVSKSATRTRNAAQGKHIYLYCLSNYSDEGADEPTTRPTQKGGREMN
jgi:hypothetical protein